MLLPPSHRPREGLETLRQVAPHLAEFATAISDALDEKVAYDSAATQATLIRLSSYVHQNPHAGGLPLLDQLKRWYLEGALSQKAFSLLTLHATALLHG